MAENEINEQETELVGDDSIDIITKLKQNSVSKDEFNKLQIEYNKAIKTLAEHSYDPNIKVASEPTEEELQKMFNDNVDKLGKKQYRGNLEAAKRLLQLHDDYERQGKGLVGLPTKGNPSQIDVEETERVWDLMRYAVETANGSESIYNGIINDHLEDNNILKRGR